MWKSVVVVLFLGLRLGECQHLICENRNPEGHASPKQEGDGTFEIEAIGRQADTNMYIPNDVYKCKLDNLPHVIELVRLPSLNS